MKKRISIAVSVVALALLLIAGTVAVTVAYLTSVKQVTNTFTVGKVEITLDETTGENYHLVPGANIPKNPTVTVVENSENCYVFVKVVNNISDVESDEADKSIAAQLEANGWVLVPNQTDVYVYTEDGSSIVEKSANKITLPVITSVNVSVDATNEDLADVDGATVVITAYAIQSEGLADVAAAWNAVKDIQP